MCLPSLPVQSASECPPLGMLTRFAHSHSVWLRSSWGALLYQGQGLVEVQDQPILAFCWLQKLFGFSSAPQPKQPLKASKDSL
jgi:hypothetical protein